ncbi:MAG: hypothetical protein RL330_977 [Actinomycetota bacterium]|jgi:hypothetical protein
MARARSFFTFPNPVNETSARIVAAGAVLMGTAFVVTGWAWILVPLTWGFVARVLAGPRLSPLGQLATRVITPRIRRPHRLVAGPPKRFAQFIGATFTLIASVLVLLDAPTAARIVVAALVVAASLEAFAGVCLGCIIFARLMVWGVIPESVCRECADISGRIPAST